MINAIQHIVRGADDALASVSLSLRSERSAVIAMLFHSLFRDQREMDQNLVDPLERTTLTSLRQTIEYYVSHDYRFISPRDLPDGVNGGGKYALLTFDDGYFNNSRALPLLNEFSVPATFFISTEHVRQNKCFWWDVIYRERIAQGASSSRIYRESLAMKRLRTEEIEAELTARFGADAFKPRGEIDRPFTPDELREFARSPYVHLGNHTANHAILTNYDSDHITDQIRRAQESLKEMTGVSPGVIAYPNGAHDERIVRTCNELGLKVGFTIRPQKNRLPLDPTPPSLLRLGRFVLQGNKRIARQCRTFRSDFLCYTACRDLYLFLTRRRGRPAA